MRSLSVILITAFGAVAIVAITALAIFAPGDASTAIGHVLVVVGTVFTYLRSTANAAKIQAVHVDVNDRLSQLVRAEKSASHAEGAAQERDRGKRPGASL